MTAPDKESRLQLLEKLEGPQSGPPWKWIAMVGLGVLTVVGLVLLFAFGAGRRPRPQKRARSPELPAATDSQDRPITASRARPTPGHARPRPRAQGPARPAPPLRTADGLLLHRGKITAGTALITVLKSAGASSRQGLSMLNALGKHFNLRRARPGHRYELHVDPKTQLPLYLRYQVSLARVYEVRRVGDGYESRPVKIPVSKHTLRYGGMIALSLGAELAARGAHPALLGRILGVLTSKPRFFRAQRFGDFFGVLVEEERVAGHHLRFGPVLALEYVSQKTGTLRLYHYRVGKKPGVYYNDKGISLPTARLHIPVHYTRISSPFGMRFHPVLKRRKLHSGVDLVAPSGTHVRATLPGKVVFTGRRGAYGNLVVLDHGNGLQSYYAHLLRFRRGLKRGQKVRQRYVIGYVGNTGRSTGAHLHFSLKLRGKWIDPLAYRLRPGAPPPPGHRGKVRQLIAQRRKLLDTTPRLGPLKLPVRIPKADEVITGVEEP